jgi:hypothetical protein
MLKYSKENINRKVVVRIDQIAYPPTVYLDTWALFDCIGDNDLADRFIKILNNLGGTLILSMVSIIESMAIDNQEQIRNLYKFIDSIGADKVAFLDFNFIRVIDNEKKYTKNNGQFLKINPAPAIDLELLDAFIKIHKPKNTLKVSEIFSAYQQDLENGKVLEENWEQSLFPIILRARNNINALSNAKKRFRKRKENANAYKFPCTEFLWESCIDYIAINENMKMPNKEWRDIFHTIVPVAYCDFVLIDKRWKNFVKTNGLNPPQIAKVYAQRNLSEFLKDLENWKGPY